MRRIIPFGKDQVYFECNNHFLSEDGLCHIGRYFNIYQGSRPFHLGSSQESEQQSLTDRKLWYHLIGDYTSRNLTHRHDKLPALSRLARIFKDRFQAEYVAGLWSNDLIEGML